MRLRLGAFFAVIALLCAMPVHAQPRRGVTGRLRAPAAEAPPQNAPAAEEEEAPSSDSTLRAPTFERPNVEAPAEQEAVEDEAAEQEPAQATEPAAPTPTEAAEATPSESAEASSDTEVVVGEQPAAQGGVTSSDPTVPNSWTSPQSVLTLHGYLRTRLEFQNNFFLNRTYANGADLPFDQFHPADSRPGTTVDGGCGSSGGTGNCGGASLLYATMRARLAPQLNLSDDVRVKFMFDVFDNMVLGSTADASFVGTDGLAMRAGAFSPLQPFVTSAMPPTYARNSLSDSIVARRAWAEVRNRTLGELRFGRMGFHWGLGLLANSGDTLDSDYSTEVDRVMAITKLWGFYMMAAYDFSFAGLAQSFSGNSRTDTATSYDPSMNDDVRQFFAAIAHRADAEEQEAALERGDFVLNYGAFFTYRSQTIASVASSSMTPAAGDSLSIPPTAYVRRGAEIFTPDVWVQFLWKKLRIEFEGAVVAGSIDNIENTYSPKNLQILQVGLALESEYRLLDDKLGIYLNMGYASGDSNAEGLGAFADTLTRQNSRSSSISTFRFHPNYRVDLILWRQIMRQITGAYYFRPGVSYDFLRSNAGRLLGGRVDVIYSRASSPVQTWGNDANLGVELNASIYFRSEDGPELFDGFHAMLQYGVLFPLDGLGYLSNNGVDQIAGGNPSLSVAHTLRVVLGVAF